MIGAEWWKSLLEWWAHLEHLTFNYPCVRWSGRRSSPAKQQDDKKRRTGGNAQHWCATSARTHRPTGRNNFFKPLRNQQWMFIFRLMNSQQKSQLCMSSKVRPSTLTRSHVAEGESIESIFQILTPYRYNTTHNAEKYAVCCGLRLCTR